LHALAVVALIAAIKKVSGNILFNNCKLLCPEGVHVVSKWTSPLRVVVRENEISIDTTTSLLAWTDFVACALRC
jgi:hypothetical protein